jgi:hypothetical protein
MAEQLGLHQRFGERAVDRHEGRFARAEVVDMARHQLFAGAGFANDQHAGFAGRDLLQVREQAWDFGSSKTCAVARIEVAKAGEGGRVSSCMSVL